MKTLLGTRSPGKEPTRDIGKVDVVVLTKNSENRLEQCLCAVYQNVPVNRLIIVDGYSTDRTLDIVKKFQKGTQNVLLIQDHGWRGRARQIGIEHVETEWFMFVDSDVQLCKGWLEKAKNFASAQVGAVWGIDVWTIIKNPRFLRLFLHLTMSIFQARGGTHDLLVRREAVKDIKIPNTLYSFEDAYIKESINKRGYEVIGAYDPYCIHYRRLTACSIKSAFDMAQSARALIRAGMFHKYSKLLLSYGFFTAYFVYQNLRQTRVLYSSSKTR